MPARVNAESELRRYTSRAARVGPAFHDLIVASEVLVSVYESGGDIRPALEVLRQSVESARLRAVDD